MPRRLRFQAGQAFHLAHKPTPQGVSIVGVIYDRQRACLFLARDRFGEKPLYFSHRAGLFAFASELSALARHAAVPHSIDPRALQKLFAYGYIPAPCALLAGVQKLPGGHWLRFDLCNAALRQQAYWQFRLEPDDSLSAEDEPRLIDELTALLVQAARRRLMSDVPLGVFLSGGIDSSLVLTALAIARPSDRFETFTIGFAEPSFDERPYARAVAARLGSHHYERVLGIEQMRELMPVVLGGLDEPLGDASILPTAMLSAFAREKVTVALTGDGGDELFAGYDPFLALKPAALYARLIPACGHRGLRRLADLLPISPANMSLDFKLRRSLMGLSYPANMRLPVWMAPVEPRDLAALLEAPVRVEEVYDEAIALWDSGDGKPVVDRALEFFTTFYLQDDILMKVDRAAMMHSLETRAVFLDNDLVDFCRRLPNHFKLCNGERKYLLKQVARRQLPAAISDRKKKGFGIPLATWLCSEPAEPPIQPIDGVRSGWARQAWDDHRAGRADRRLFLWTWLSLQHVAEVMATSHPEMAYIGGLHSP
ncbi:MAG: asparagine synthase (glutamine-hydrolyzing) [Alphaproteobacteria bacterium]|nr:asparagine synthase (glutamine-hydrolyzing) [Alphaproteobacteria bacterium]